MKTTLFLRRSQIQSCAGFSLVELIVVILVLSILSTIAFVSFSNSAVDARNSTRKTDMAEMKTQLRSNKQTLGSYPLPASNFSLTNNGVAVVYQGNSDAITKGNSTKLRIDPRTARAYMYSSLTNRQSYQIGMTLEWASILRAYVDGDYLALMPSIFPSLLLAVNTTSDLEVNPGIGAGATNQLSFIVNNSSINIPYDTSGKAVTKATLFTDIASENWVSLPSASDYTSCQAIADAGLSMWSGTYLILDASGWVSGTGCTITP